MRTSSSVITVHLSVIRSLSVRGDERGAHYIVDLDGHVIKIADEHYMTWHAGGSAWHAREALNQFSVGIEIIHDNFKEPGTTEKMVNGKKVPVDYTPREFFQEQYDAVIRLCFELQTNFSISIERVVGHCDGLLGNTPTEAKYPGGSANYPNGHYPHYRKGGKVCPSDTFQWTQLEVANVARGRSIDFGIPTLNNVPSALNGTSGDARMRAAPGVDPAWFKMIKQMLFDIGYSVSDRRMTSRDALDGTLDPALVMAVRAFQVHHHSGAHRRFRARTAKPPRTAVVPPFHQYGHMDDDTVHTIHLVWEHVTGKTL